MSEIDNGPPTSSTGSWAAALQNWSAYPPILSVNADIPPLQHRAKGLNQSRGRVPEAPDTVDPIVGGDALFETKPVALAHDDCELWAKVGDGIRR
jgi:hypothetical protein